ncbi:MAG TPA: ROK family protein [Spirochaetota bacterium]|nr:ROK family protein [Spirochaetota bacterium]
MKYYAGIDLGGTKIYSIIIDENGKILGREKIKTEGSDSFDNVIDRVKECYYGAIKNSNINEKEIEAIGMAVPSSVNVDKGILIYAPNLGSGWRNIELSKIMFEKLRRPFFMDNDVNMGVFGEYCLGAGKNYNHIYGLFVGTGIGGGYIKNGEIIRGVNYTAGEIGHMVVKIGGPKCNCGRKGCLEAISGKVGIINYIIKLVEKKGEKTILGEIAPNWKKGVGSSALSKCFMKNDRVVVKALTRAAKTIGIAIANLINAIGIETIILGGGLIEELGDVLIPIIKEYMVEYSIADGAKGIPLLKAELGDDAVAMGAAWFTKQKENERYLYKG